MRIVGAIKGILKVLWKDTKEDWFYMDRKLWRIITYVIGFSLMAAFWWFFFRNTMPF